MVVTVIVLSIVLGIVLIGGGIAGFFFMRKIGSEMASLKEELAFLRDENNNLVEENESLSRERDELTVKDEELSARFEDISARLSDATEKLSETEGLVLELRKKEKLLSGSNAKLKTELSETSAKLDGANSEKADISAKLDEAVEDARRAFKDRTILKDAVLENRELLLFALDSTSREYLVGKIEKATAALGDALESLG